ncbi:hypothetical protein Tsubulata_030214 [Turnera subulata]|uniref:Uncharacterized protein n=1 Tax=Turnera subulata TaxID=218843 RepID=A0A9Q0G0T7_9ROSI|nr:hypothetical protein Tsubulata_030214 [Turnera subulata]
MGRTREEGAEDEEEGGKRGGGEEAGDTPIDDKEQGEEVGRTRQTQAPEESREAQEIEGPLLQGRYPALLRIPENPTRLFAGPMTRR